MNFGYVTVNGVNSNVFSITREGETADIQHYLDEHKISEESQYDGLYAVCTDLLGDEVSDILKVSEGRWQIEEFFTSRSRCRHCNCDFQCSQFRSGHYLSAQRPDEFRFQIRNMKIEKNALKMVLAIGIPAGIQDAIFSVSNVFIQSGINSFGENAIAGSSLAVIFMIWDDFFVGIYITSSAVALYGLVRMHHVCSLEGLTATYEVESAALRGMGKSLEPSIITILGTVVFHLVWMVTVFKWIPIYDMLMNVYVASWIFTGGAIFIIYWHHMKKVSKLGIR